MGLVAAAGLARHTVLVDISFSFAVVLLCLSSSSLYDWARTSSNDDEVRRTHPYYLSSSETQFYVSNQSQLASLPDFSPCFIVAAVLAFLGGGHFGMVRYQEFKVKSETGEEITSSAGTDKVKVENDNSDADEESEERVRRKPSSKSNDSLNILKGKWLAIQASFCLTCLYGGRLLAGSLFGAYYSHLPTYDTDSVSTVDYDEERESSVIANVLLWATTTIGALLASNLVSNWTAGKRNISNDLALTRVTLVALTGTALPPLFMLITDNR